MKFGKYTNSNVQTSMVIISFFNVDQECPLWANLVQKTKTVSWSLNLLLKTHSDMENSTVMFTWCFQKYSSWANLVQKFKTYLLKLKFGPCTNWNMQNSIVVLILCFWLEILFLSKFGSKNQNLQLMLKLCTKSNWIIRIQWWFSFFLFLTWDLKYPFWANLFQKPPLSV